MLWAAATMFCGFAGSFPALFGGRFFIGAGESVCGPAAMSLIRDGLAPAQRGRAVAIWAMGAGVGGGLALLSGGAILHLIGDATSVVLPVIGQIRSWQLVLICSGLMALPVGLLVFSFPEPQRQASRQARSAVGMKEALAFMAQNWGGLRAAVHRQCVHDHDVDGLFDLDAGDLRADLALGTAEIGFNYGLIALFLSTASQFIAGIVVDRIGRSGRPASVPLVGLAVAVAALVPSFTAPLAPSAGSAWACSRCLRSSQRAFSPSGPPRSRNLRPRRWSAR